MKIAKEDFSRDLYEEILPLGQKCWEESTRNKADTCAYYGERDFRIDPDVTRYELLSQIGALVIVTLRDEGKLVGYAAGYLYRSFHHRSFLCGAGDTIYIEPEYRSYTPVVAELFEQEFRSKGAAIIGWPTHVNGPVYEFLKARGYVGDDVVMEKRLCA